MNSQDKKQSPRTRLLAWNPNKWEWRDFNKKYKAFRCKDSDLILKWGCGQIKTILQGDIVYLIRLGKIGSQGIIASGTVTQGSYGDAHWNGVKGKTSQFIDFKVDQLVHHELETNLMIPMSELDSLKLKIKQDWHPKQSGASINEEAAEYLDRRWLKTQATILCNEYTEGKALERTIRSYERSRYARDVAIKSHGCLCFICKFSFEETYGEIGEGFIHIHHITPISLQKGKEYKVDPEKDLIPVCPNCHAMIHRNKKTRSPDEVKLAIKRLNKEFTSSNRE